MKEIIKQFVPSIVLQAAQKLLASCKGVYLVSSPQVDIEYGYKNFSILLPEEHLLPSYQKHHPKYDRFLPHLARFIDSKYTIIDIGANCGDTLAAMVDENPGPKYICIEPDEAFFDYLNKNITRIRKAMPLLRVEVIQSLIGLDVKDAVLEGGKGTKHAVIGKGAKSSRTLDEIISEYQGLDVKLIKIDVDGFDYDVINSADALLKSCEPILFFECQYDYEYQKYGYEKTISRLIDMGYKNWTLFDNFGEKILRTNDAQQIYQMMEYVWRQNKKLSTRTVYYYDVLVVTDGELALVDSALESY